MASSGAAAAVTPYMAQLFASTAAASYQDQVIVGSPPKTYYEEMAVAHTWTHPHVDIERHLGGSPASRECAGRRRRRADRQSFSASPESRVRAAARRERRERTQSVGGETPSSAGAAAAWDGRRAAGAKKPRRVRSAERLGSRRAPGDDAYDGGLEDNGAAAAPRRLERRRTLCTTALSVPIVVPSTLDPPAQAGLMPFFGCGAKARAAEESPRTSSASELTEEDHAAQPGKELGAAEEHAGVFDMEL